MSDFNFGRVVGDALRTRRLVKRISQKQLAEMTGLAQGTVSKVESGSHMTRRSVERICDALGVSLIIKTDDGESVF